jgi:NADPH-dependent curcumin reductase CurA
VGDEAKAALATDVFGYPTAVLRTDSGWREQLASAAPDGVDAYLHMGDDDVLDGVVNRLALGARVSLCGLMNQYNDGPPATVALGPLIRARATVHGMVVYDHSDLSSEHRRRVGALLASGKLRMHEDRYRGLASAPEAFVRLMCGRNHGKVIVEVGR